jgi:hypothetical protein
MLGQIAISELIKIILVVVVIVGVILMLYFFFKNQVIGFFSGFGGNTKIFLALIGK